MPAFFDSDIYAWALLPLLISCALRGQPLRARGDPQNYVCFQLNIESVDAAIPIAVAIAGTGGYAKDCIGERLDIQHVHLPVIIDVAGSGCSCQAR